MSDGLEDFPEHQKMKLVNHKSQIIFDFVEWLGECESVYLHHDNERIGVSKVEFDSILYRYLEVDQKKFEDEKELMFKQVREASSEIPF